MQVLVSSTCQSRKKPHRQRSGRPLFSLPPGYGVEFLTRPSAEVLLRRILALAIHSGTGSWQIAEKIEELPTESPFSVVPESLLKEIMEQVKNELKVAALAKQAA